MTRLSFRDARQAWLPFAAAAWLWLSAAAFADIVHLKNGGTIACDRTEERGDDLVLHQGRSKIVVPRGEVSRIEKTVASPPRGASPSGATPGVSALREPAGGGRSAALRRLEDLKDRLERFPLAREENLAQIVALLDALGEEDLKLRHPEEARRRFEEALAYDRRDLRAKRGLAAAHLELGQDAYARSVLERALLETPADPDLLFLLGVVAQKQDRQDEALALWEQAYAARPDPALKERLTTLKRHLGVEAGYRRTDAAHFTLRYDGDRTGPDLESAVIDELERRFPELVRQFDHLPSQPIAVVVYPQRAFFEATLAESDVAGLYDGKIRLPAGGLRELDREARAVLLHELAHAFISGKSGGRAPRWLQEGLAQWIEGRRTTHATSVQLARHWQGCCPGADWGSTFTYASALSFVEFLLDREGFHRLNLVLLEMGRGRDPEEAIRTATRFTLQDLTRQWGEDLARRHLQ
jgi:tetratricopeptide (TPR) repeat protein